MVADRQLSFDAPLPERWGPWQRAKNGAIYLVVRAFAWLVQRIPFAVAEPCAAALGWLAYFVAVRERRRAVRQLGEAFPNWPSRRVKKVARQMFTHLGRCAAEATHLRRFIIGPHAVPLPADVKAVLDGAVAEGRGVVAVSGHVGNWELMAQIIANAGYDVTAIAKPLYDPRLTRWIHDERSRSGLSVLWRGDDSGAKEMLRVFRRGGILAMLIDQDTRVQGVFVPFFGKDAYTPSGAAALAVRIGAVPVVGWAQRRGGRHVLHFERVDTNGLAQDHDAAVTELTKRMTARLEHAIRETPEQWVWMHDRWKRQRPA